MTARRIDTTQYLTDQRNDHGELAAFDILGSLVALLFVVPCPPRELLQRVALADRLDATVPGQPLLLTDQEYGWLTTGLTAVCEKKPAGRVFAEFIRRVLDAPVVPVAEAKG